jgi:integrase
LAQKLMSEVDTHLLIRAATPGRNRTLLEIAYFGGLRVSELAGLTWSQIIPRETGEVQLAIVGKGDKPRNVLLPADLAEALRSIRGDAPPSARVFPITERRTLSRLSPRLKSFTAHPTPMRPAMCSIVGQPARCLG